MHFKQYRSLQISFLASKLVLKTSVTGGQNTWSNKVIAVGKSTEPQILFLLEIKMSLFPKVAFEVEKASK